MAIRSIRGTHDILPGSVERWQEIEAAVRKIFSLYGFAEIRTPIFEATDLFARGIGGETDIVQKEMYTFSDSRDNQITLRPEGTAPVVRSFLEHSLGSVGHAIKLYYIGPMFRHERPQKGRYRQFHQIGAEVLGTDHPAVEAEVLEMLSRFLGELGLEDYRLLVNSVGCRDCRPAYIELLREAIAQRADQFCHLCRRRARTNPLRVLDCKVPSCQPLIDQLPVITEHLCEACRSHYSSFLEYLDREEISYQQDSRLVRGLDYYVRTTFEIVSDRLGPTQNALLGGGRYDGLSELIGGPPIQGFGFALGLERFVLLLSGRDDLKGDFKVPECDLFMAYFDDRSLQEALRLATQLRRENISVLIDFEGRSIKAQMKLANRLGARFSMVIGDNEIESGEFTVKRMEDGVSTTLADRDIAEFLRSN